jgi:hypothetical protein
MTTLALVLAMLCGAEEVVEAPPEENPRAAHPVHLGASLGTFINAYSALPAVRLAVQPSIFLRPLNEFTVLIELGAAVGVPTADTFFAEHYDYTAIAGFGYHSDHGTWEWGFRLGVGIAYYRTTIATNQPYPHFSQNVAAYTEGRGQLGLTIAPRFKLGLFAGYGSPFAYPLTQPGSWMLGGFLTGFYLDFR